jgi:signal transduction histidine kinase/tetratricopeptide (TPR) repeat protein
VAATLARSAGDRRRALGLLEDALADATALGEPRLSAQVLHALGGVELHAGDHGRARLAFERAIAEATAAGDVAMRARALADLGRAAHLGGDWGGARRAWERALQLWERLDDRQAMARALVDLGALYTELGLLDDARTTLDRAIDLAASIDLPAIRAEARAARGDTLVAAGDHAGARAHYDDALVELVRVGARDAAIATRRRLAALALCGGRAEEAIGRAVEAAREARDGGLRLEEAALYRIAAAATRLTGDLATAAALLARARELLAPLAAVHPLALVDVEAAEQEIAAGRADAGDALFRRAEMMLAQLAARGDLERVRARRRDGRRASRDALDLPGLLATAADAIAAAGKDDDAAAILLEHVLAASSLERGFVVALDDDGRPRVLVRRLRAGARGFDAADAELCGTIVRRVAATGQAAAVGDAALDAALREQRSVIVLGLRRIVCAPLRAGGRVVGVVYLDATTVLADGADLGLRDLAALAPVFALLVERARLAADAARMRELMSILAHEVRNPLASILGYTELCRDPELDSDVTADDAIERIHGDAERIGRVVENVLEVTRHERGNLDWSMTAIDVGALALDLARSHQLACDRRRIRLSLEIEAYALALGNRDRLGQVITNLLANAVKFTPAAGTITIAVRREVVRAGDPTAPPAPATELRAWVPAADGEVLGEFIRIDVRDTGPGMSAELRAQIFAKFMQGPGSSRGRGIGLGLYISREIVRRHGGSIWVDSEPGNGAVFSVRVPVAL